MAAKTTLKVNNTQLELNPFVESYLYHVAAGMVASLKDTGTIKKLTIEVLDSADVKLNLNGKDIPLNIFVTEIFFNTLAGLVKDLKGVDGKLKTLVLKIQE
jgi:hypothetical protein